MASTEPIFGAMLQEFDEAARILNLEPGIWNILTHPKRQIIVSCPVQMDNGEIEVFTGYRVQYNITLGPAKGGIRYHPGRLARRGDGAGRVDDVEVRGRAHPVRRRQGRHHLRPDQDVAPRARGAHPPLRRGDHRRDRPGEGRAGARRQHQRADHGVGHGHLQHARRPHGDRRRHRQAGRDRRIARPPRSDRTRRHDLRARIGQAPRLRHQGRDGRRPGLRQRRLGVAQTCSRETGAKIVAVTDWKGGVYNAKGLDIPALLEYAAQHKTVAGFTGGEPLTNEQLFTLDVDVLIPAALENQITMDNAPHDPGEDRRRRRQRPDDADAHAVLHERGDLRRARHPGQQRRRHGVVLRVGAGPLRLLLDRRRKSTNGSSTRCARRSTPCCRPRLPYKVDMRTAAYIVAIKRVADVTRVRGMYA